MVRAVPGKAQIVTRKYFSGTVAPVTPPPVNTVPWAQTILEDAPMVFSAANSRLISVAAGNSGTLSTVLSVSRGTLAAAAFAGATITGNNTFSVTVAGTAAAINGAIANLTHTGVPDFNGTYTLTVRTTEGTITASDTVVVTVTAVVDAFPDSATTAYNTSTTVNVSTNDSFEGASLITAVDGKPIVANQTVAILNGTVQLFNGSLIVTPATNFIGNLDFTYQVSAGAMTETANVTITVNGPVVVTPPPQPKIAFGVGVNLVGMSVYYTELRKKVNLPNNHFAVPRANDIAYLASKGFIKSRLPVTWELLQPVLADTNINLATRGIIGVPGEFSAMYASYITEVLDAHAAVGMKCVIDLNNNCRYTDFVYQADGTVLGLVPSPDATAQAYTETVGQTRMRIFALAAGATLTQAHFTDVWTKAATRWKAHAGFGGYGLMERPFNLPAVGAIVPGQGEDLAIWPAYAQAAINAIRAVDTTGPIYVSGNRYSNIYEMGVANPGFPLTGTGLIYEGILFLDRDNSGQFFDYTTEATQPSVGEVGNVTAATGYNRFNTARTWANSKTPVPNLAIREIGVPIDDARWQLSAKNAIDLAVLQGSEIYASHGGSFYYDRNGPINSVPQWHQNRPKEPLIFGTMRKAANHIGFALFDDSQSFGAVNAPITVTVYARGNVDAVVNLTIAKSTNATGTLSKTTLTIPVGANGSDSYTYTPTSAQVATLTYAGSLQVPPPRKMYSLTDAPAYEATSLTDAAHNILAKYGASKWEMRDGFNDYVMGGPALAGERLRAVSDSGFGSTPDSAMEMLDSTNTGVNQGTRLSPVLRNSAANVRSGDFSAFGTAGLWSRKNISEHPGHVPKNKCLFEIQDANFSLVCLSVPTTTKTGAALMTSVTYALSRAEIRLEAGKAQAVFRDNAGLTSTLNATAVVPAGTPTVVTATSAAGAQKLRVASSEVATDAKTFGATVFNAHTIGEGYYEYNFREGFGGTVFGAIIGKGTPTALELGVLERYLLSVAGVASAAPVQPNPDTQPTPEAVAPNITTQSAELVVFQVGSGVDNYMIEEDRWGSAGISEGPAANQYMQEQGVSYTLGPNGEIAWRARGRWPDPAGSSEVKSYPAASSGRKPGTYSANNLYQGYKPVRLADGSNSSRAPSGDSPGTFLPLQLPLPPMYAKARFKMNAPPTGKGQLVYDIWLQSTAEHGSGFQASSITHEIMIQLQNWGVYGGYHLLNGGKPGWWYDHDITIDGLLWHVYATKSSTDGGLRYDFGGLNGAYGRTGWKMISFVPEFYPVVKPIRIDQFINHLRTRVDVFGTPWLVGNEFLTNLMLGIEPNQGTFDLTMYDYKYALGTPPTGTVVTPPPGSVPTEAEMSASTFNFGAVARKGAWLQTKDPYLLGAAGTVITAVPSEVGTWVDRSPNDSRVIELDGPSMPTVNLFGGTGPREVNIYNNMVAAKGGSGEVGVDLTKGFFICQTVRPWSYAVTMWSDEGAVNTGRYMRWSGAGAAGGGQGDIEFSVGNGAGRVSVRSMPGAIVTPAPHENPTDSYVVYAFHDVAANTLNMIVGGQTTTVPFTGTFAAGAAGYAFAGKPALSFESNVYVREHVHAHHCLDAPLRSTWLNYFNGATPAVVTPPPPPPPPPVAGVSMPFASRTVPYVTGVIKPTSLTQTQMDDYLRSQYDYWKGSGVKTGMNGRFVAFNGIATATVSEGIGYGMLLAVIFAGHDPGARALFDDLYNVSFTHPAWGFNDPNMPMMEWKLDANMGIGSAHPHSDGGGWSAIDGDLDIAQALLMAHKQWGSNGAINYLARGIAIINAMKQYVIRSDGSTSGTSRGDTSRTSDYMTGHFKAFKRATGDAFWDTVINKSFALLEHCQTNISPTAKLVPDFLMDVTGANPQPAFAADNSVGDGNGTAHFYTWNAFRNPWRMAADYVLTGDIRARNVGSRYVDFFINKHAGNISVITGAYRMDGSEVNPGSGNVTLLYEALAPAAACESRFQSYYDSIWTKANNPPRTTGYYGTEIGLLALCTASGNWWSP